MPVGGPCRHHRLIRHYGPDVAEAWVSDEDLRNAHDRFAERIPVYRPPAAYGVARRDADGMVFGHVNPPGAVRPLPAVVLATVCGYTNSTTTVRINKDRFQEAIRLLAPAEAAIHMPHPNLWSWRRLLAEAGADAEFFAFFIAKLDDPPSDDLDAQFRDLLNEQQLG